MAFERMRASAVYTICTLTGIYAKLSRIISRLRRVRGTTLYSHRSVCRRSVSHRPIVLAMPHWHQSFLSHSRAHLNRSYPMVRRGLFWILEVIVWNSAVYIV